MVIIEITKNNTIDKVRSDITTRLDAIRDYLYRTERVFASCYLICGFRPSSSMVECANKYNVKLMTLSEFRNEFLDYNKYFSSRKDHIFGSAFNPMSGKKDTFKYISIAYTSTTGNEYSVNDLAQQLANGKKIILLGDYGTGKSRCVEELFLKLNKLDTMTFSYNIRDMWGLKTKAEIICRHVTELGLAELADPMIRMLKNENACFLLDGFDEIGTQVWGTDLDGIKTQRNKALIGVRDIISECKGGMLVAGRFQYFNSEDEMLKCLGLNKKDTLIVKCPNEFSYQQIEEFLRRESKLSIEALPANLPKRPLIYSILSSLDAEDIDELFCATSTELAYWNLFIHRICDRESRINGSMLSGTIEKILVELAHQTRWKANNTGPISREEIALAYCNSVGSMPTDEATIILQRLPGLGLIDPLTTDRQFIDLYILNGLRASHFISTIATQNDSVTSEAWKTALDDFGFHLLAEDIAANGTESYWKYAMRNKCMPNGIFAGELLLSLLNATELSSIDFRSFSVQNAHLPFVDFSHKDLKNLSITSTFIDILNISGTAVTNVCLFDCDVNRVEGIGGIQGLPNWVGSCTVGAVQAMTNTKRARSSKLVPGQIVLLTILQKTFFQRGNGRQEDALFRGLSDGQRRIVDTIASEIIKAGLVSVVHKDGINIYVPERAYMNRVVKIREELTLSKDPLWTFASTVGP